MAPSSPIPRVLVLGYARAGSSILLALGRRPLQFHTSLLVRPSSAASKADALAPFRALGVELVEGDLAGADEAQLTPLLRGYHTVISCVTHQRAGTDELRLVRACKAAGVTHYLPTAWGVDEAAVGPHSPMSYVFDQKVAGYAAMGSSGLPCTIVSCGLWTEWLLGSGGGDLLSLDWPGRTITAVGGFNCKVSTTSLLDLGDLVAELLLDLTPTSPTPTPHQSHVHLQSDLVTLEQIAQALEQATGQPWVRKVVGVEEAEALQAAAPGTWTWVFRIIIARQQGVWWPVEESWNNAGRQLPFKLHKLQEVTDRVAEERGMKGAK